MGTVRNYKLTGWSRNSWTWWGNSMRSSSRCKDICWHIARGRRHLRHQRLRCCNKCVIVMSNVQNWWRWLTYVIVNRFRNWMQKSTGWSNPMRSNFSNWRWVVISHWGSWRISMRWKRRDWSRDCWKRRHVAKRNHSWVSLRLSGNYEWHLSNINRRCSNWRGNFGRMRRSTKGKSTNCSINWLRWRRHRKGSNNTQCQMMLTHNNTNYRLISVSWSFSLWLSSVQPKISNLYQHWPTRKDWRGCFLWRMKRWNWQGRHPKTNYISWKNYTMRQH